MRTHSNDVGSHEKVSHQLFAFLAGTSLAMAADAGCDAFKWPVTREQALFPQRQPLSPAVPWQSGKRGFHARSGRHNQLCRAAERAPAAGTSARRQRGRAAGGELQISLSMKPGSISFRMARQ